MPRSRKTTIAAILVFLYCLQGVVRLFVSLVTQDEAFQNAGVVFIAASLIMASIGLVAAYGIWQNQKWGKILAIVILTINTLTALPGILFAPFPDKIGPLVGTIVAIVVVVLLLKRSVPSEPA